MEQEQKPTQETHPEESQLNSAGGDEAVSDANTPDPLAVINEVTGRDYKDLDTAKESLKEMQKEASQKVNIEKEVEALKATPNTPEELKEVVAKLQTQLNETTTENFFAQNPEHKANRGLLEKIAKADGVSVKEAIASTEYKAVFEAQGVANEAQSRRTVAQSNNRVAQSGGEENLPPVNGDKHDLGDWVTKQYFNKK